MNPTYLIYPEICNPGESSTGLRDVSVAVSVKHVINPIVSVCGVQMMSYGAYDNIVLTRNSTVFRLYVGPAWPGMLLKSVNVNIVPGTYERIKLEAINAEHRFLGSINGVVHIDYVYDSGFFDYPVACALHTYRGDDYFDDVIIKGVPWGSQ